MIAYLLSAVLCASGVGVSVNGSTIGPHQCQPAAYPEPFPSREACETYIDRFREVYEPLGLTLILPRCRAMDGGVES